MAAKWLDEAREAELMRRVAAGDSAGRIATAMSASLGRSVTRNAILRAVHRLRAAGKAVRLDPRVKMPARKPVAKCVVTKPTVAKAVTKPVVKPTVAKPVRKPIVKPSPVAEPIDLREAFVAGDRPTIAFSAIRNGLCRWPFDDEDDDGLPRFCGARAAGVYCATHAALSYTPMRQPAAIAASRGTRGRG